MIKKIKEFKKMVNEWRKTESFDEIACQIRMTGSMLILFTMYVPILRLIMKCDEEDEL